MSQKILSTPEKYACLQKENMSSKRQHKCKGNFQEELLDLQWEQMILHQEQKKRSNDRKHGIGGTRKRQKILAEIRQIVFW